MTRIFTWICVALLLTCTVASEVGFGQTINTVAGTGTAGFSGDGGAATSAQLSSPYGVFVDGSGNIYIADQSNHRIRKVDTSGNISTVAGTGTSGFSGDGGAATSAQLNVPYSVFVDGSGNIYIADVFNFRIRKVSTAGIITTVAGNGSFLFSGDGGPATSAGLAPITGVSVDGSGNIYISDQNNHRIRKVSTSGTISTVVGTGTAGFSGDGGAATGAQLNLPQGVFTDGPGNIYIADRSNHRVRKVSTSGTISTVVGTGTAGFSGDGGAATGAQLSSPGGVAVDGSGNIYIADTGNNRIRKVDTSGNITTVAGSGSGVFSGDGGPATSGGLPSPTGVSVDGSGNIYIATQNNHRVRKVTVLTINETTAAAGLSGATTVAGGNEVKIFSIGLTGDGVANLNSVTLTISDLSTATGLTSSDFSALRLYRSTDATLDGGDTQIGSQSSVNIGSATTVSATTADTPPSGIERFYIVSAVISSGATQGHALKVGVAAGGVVTSGGSRGSAVTANDANKVTIGLTAPTLVTANSTALQRHLSITLDWSDVTGATSYTLEYANNSGFTGSTTVTGVTASQYTFSSPPADGTYYWRVKAVGSGVESSFSAANNFAIIPTFTEWTVVLLAMAMMGYMIWYRRRARV